MMAIEENQSGILAKYEKAALMSAESPENAISLLQSILADVSNTDTEDVIRAKELSILKLGEIFKQLKRPNDLASLITTSRPLLAIVPKAKTSRIIRSLLDLLAAIPDTLQLQLKLCTESIEWCKQERRVFLRQSLETRLSALYLENKQYSDALSLISNLLRELKRLDDKLLLVEVQLLESRVCHALHNLPKSRAALTSARTSANAIYCPPLLQAPLDMQSGVLHAEEKDYKTAYSYFAEALENYSSQEDAKATLSLKYMLMCKIMMNVPEEVMSMMTGRLALKYAGSDMDAMKAIAQAHMDRSLHDFERVLKSYSKELKDDPIIGTHLSALYDTLLGQHLIRLIEPFSCVEIQHISELIQLDIQTVERKLSQMILDKKFRGILDQGNGQLIVYEEDAQGETYDLALKNVAAMNEIVDALYLRSRNLL